MAVSRAAGAVDGVPRLLLRLEGLALAVGALYMYHRLGANWWWFVLVLVPDLSLLAYFVGTRPGAIAYNAFHITLVPLALYWSKGRAKLEIGLARGKKLHDKRAAEKDRDWERQKGRLMRGH